MPVSVNNPSDCQIVRLSDRQMVIGRYLISISFMLSILVCCLLFFCCFLLSRTPRYHSPTQPYAREQAMCPNEEVLTSVLGCVFICPEGGERHSNGNPLICFALRMSGAFSCVPAEWMVELDRVMLILLLLLLLLYTRIFKIFIFIFLFFYFFTFSLFQTAHEPRG